MKVISKGNVYVQMQDMGYLNSSDVPIPASIFMKVFGKGVTIIDVHNRFDYVCFDEPHEIAYFKNLDFIIDYEEYKDLSLGGKRVLK